MKGFISRDLHPLLVILYLLAFVVGGFFVANFLSLVLINLLYGYDPLDVATLVQNPGADPASRNPVLLFQAMTHFFGFTVGPLLFLQFCGHNLRHYLSYKAFLPLGLLLLSAILFMLIMPANSVLIQWNEQLHFPEFMRSFEYWARDKEDSLRELTQQLTQFTTIGDFLVGLLVFALIPAIGEEIVFRGILQRNLIAWTRNVHLGIWLTALIFGAIHLQFFGFFPRMVLGALFGYLYVWSGRLWVPIAGHFMNNGFTVLALYLRHTKLTTYDIEATDAVPWQAVLFSVVVSCALLYYLWLGFRQVPVSPLAEGPGFDEPPPPAPENRTLI